MVAVCYVFDVINNCVINITTSVYYLARSSNGSHVDDNRHVVDAMCRPTISIGSIDTQRHTCTATVNCLV